MQLKRKNLSSLNFATIPKNKVSTLAKAEGKNISEIVRELLENYVKNRDISGYINNLWERIGTKIRKQEVSPSDIDAIINQVRTQK